MKPKPLIAITLGDPAGHRAGDHRRRVDRDGRSTNGAGRWSSGIRAFSAGQSSFGRPTCTCKRSTSPDEAEPSQGVIPCLACGDDEVLDIKPGKLDARAGQAAYEAVVAAAQLGPGGQGRCDHHRPAAKGSACAGPGHKFPGHTELLASLCGVDNFAMMLYLGPDEVVAIAGADWPWSTSRCTRRCGTCSTN